MCTRKRRNVKRKKNLLSLCFWRQERTKSRLKRDRVSQCTRTNVHRINKYEYFEHEYLEAERKALSDFKRSPDKMEAEYVGFYLGSSMLTKGTTGLGVIQKPLRDKYFAYRKSPDNKIGPEIGIRINPKGIVLLFPGGHPGQPNDEFYAISSIHFIEAVQFVTMKNKDKKFYGAFLPIDDPEGNPNQDKLFVQIEKKFNHLSKMSHPPMLACVMRRPTGVKAVDCHMFIIPVVEDALRIADMVHRFQERPDHPEFYHGRPPPDPRDFPPEPDVIPRNLGPPRERDPRISGSRDSDDNAFLYKGRGLELKQEHFVRGNTDDESRFEVNRNYDRDFREELHRYPIQNSGRPGSFEFRDRDRNYPRDIDRDPYPDKLPREMVTPGGRYVERDSFGSEHEFDNRVIHERQRSGGGKEINRFSGGISPRNEFPDRHSGGFSPRNEFSDRPNLPPRSDYNGLLNRGPDNYQGGRFPDTSTDQLRGLPPQWQKRGSGEESRSFEYPRPLMRDQHPRSPPLSPRGWISPRSHSPPRGHSSPRARSPERDDQVFSASNLESRMEEVQTGKPVAKVPPNRHAGVRVLPSLPIADAKNILKPVSPRTSDVPAKAEERPPTYNFNIKAESDGEENPYDNNMSEYRQLNRHTRPTSENSPLAQRRTDFSNNVRTKSDDYGSNYGNNLVVGNQQSARHWSYEDEKEKFLKTRDGDGWSNASKSKSAHDGFSGPGLNDRGGRHMKDMEIEDMFSNMRTSNPGRSDFDFERSLGYLP